MCTRCGALPCSTRKGVAKGLCCNKCPNHGPWCSANLNTNYGLTIPGAGKCSGGKCSGLKKCEATRKAVKAPSRPVKAISKAEVSDKELPPPQENELPPPQEKEITFDGTWYTSTDVMKKQPQTIARGILTWPSGGTTVLHFPDEVSVGMNFQGTECKGTLKEDSIMWDDGDIWLRADPAPERAKRAPRAEKPQKGRGKGKRRQQSLPKAPMAKRRRFTLRAPAPASPATRQANLQMKAKIAEDKRREREEAAAAKAASREANLQMAEEKRQEKEEAAEEKRKEKEAAAAAKAAFQETKLQLAEEKRQEKEEAAAAKAALRQVNLEAKAQLAEARRQEKKALADVKAGLREFKAERAGQQNQTKKFMKEMNKDFQKVLKSSLTSKPTANSSMSTCEPSGAEATDSADLECTVEDSVPAIDEVTVPVTNPVVTEGVSEVIPDLCKEASDVSQNSPDV